MIKWFFNHHIAKEYQIMVLNFAHRGSLTEAPENTVAAINKALQHKAQAIEMDVRLTKDEQLVLIHDHHLKRFNKRAKRDVRDYTLKEIKEIDIGSSLSNEFSYERLATLEEVLAIIPEDVFLNIEIKNTPIVHDHIGTLVLKCLRNYERTKNLMISSFDHGILQQIQKEDPTIPLELLFLHRMIKPWTYVSYSRLNVYSIHPNKIHVTKDFIAQCHNAGYKVYPYTVNDLETYHQFLNWVIDGVFSNNPQIFSAR